jgi:transposase
MELTRRTGTSRTSVWRWQERFLAEGIPGLLRDKTRPSRIPPLGTEVEARVVAATQTAAPGETTHWTLAAMARHIGISVSSVQRIWRKHGLQPHKIRQFTLSSDPRFAAQLLDIVGLYVNPPEHAVVLSIDEESQIQALDRTQPGLPMTKGRCGTMTHDYKRNGTTTLFAALNVLDGTVSGRCMQRHRHQEFIRFLNATEAAVPTGKAIHAIVDNYATHKHPKVREWLDRHPRWRFHFTPTSASWLNAVEGFSPNSPSGVSNAACFVRSSNFRPRSIASCQRPTPTRGPSGGQRIRTKLSPPSKEGTKCQILSTTANRRSVGTGIATVSEEGSGILSGDAVERGSECVL